MTNLKRTALLAVARLGLLVCALLLVVHARAADQAESARLPSAAKPGTPDDGWGPEAGGLRSKITLSKSQLRVGEPIRVNHVLRNVSKSPIEVWHCGFWPNHKVVVCDAMGREIGLTERGQQARRVFDEDLRRKNIPFTLQPGAEDPAGPFDLAELSVLTQSGRYTVQVIYREGKLSVLSTSVAFEIVAADPNGPRTVTEADNRNTVQVALGQTIEVRLEGDQSRTGWEASAVEGQAVVREGARPGEIGVPQSPRFTPQPGAADKALGTYVFRYQAVAEGTAKLRFVYVFPGGPEPIRRTATKLVRELAVTIEVGTRR